MSVTSQVPTFPYGAQSNGFFSALTSAVMYCHAITEDTPVFCGPNGRHCNLCHKCGIQNRLQKHHSELYHALLTASGTAFTFDYPEDDDVAYHTMPDVPIGWRWDEPFLGMVMDVCGLTYDDILRRIHTVLTDPSHAKLEAELMDELCHITAENAVGMAYKLMGICGVFIETRWHAAEGMANPENPIGCLAGNADVKKALGDICFNQYVDINNNTHEIGWKIWGCLGVGPETGYMPTEQSFHLILQPEVQADLARLYHVVFENDRIVADAIRKELERSAG